ncbi:alpha/beta fold hydrolase [Streptomyces sp. NPDC047972]|uniref:alpha/beta fold hydrolase n=1 Tax=Streptomyces sp. NPDC047972 TaxID=3365493 RepID=UPI00371A8661
METDAYRMLGLVEDNVAVVHALGEANAVVVGHDWGASIAATSALLHPEVFRAVGMLSVPYAPPGGPAPPTSSAGSAALSRSSTSPTSRSPAGPRRRSSPMSGAGSRASTPLCRPTPCPPRASPTRTSAPAAVGCVTASPQASSRPG